MRTRSDLLSRTALAVSVLFILHCSSPEDPPDSAVSSHEPAALRLMLTDAPTDEASAVYINVVETRVRFTPAAVDPTPAPDASSPTTAPDASSPDPAQTPESDEDADEGDEHGSGDEQGGGDGDSQDGDEHGEADHEDGDEHGDADAEEGWTSVGTEAATYDLLTLQDSVTALLGETLLEAGTISQIRLVLDAENPGSVVVDGQSYPLTVPSGSESGLKLSGDIELASGTTTTVVLDFDAEQSIVATGNGEYKLKPVLSISSVTTEEGTAVTAE